MCEDRTLVYVIYRPAWHFAGNRCAEEIAFNEFRLASPTLSPWGRMLGIGEERHFYNVQVLGKLVCGKFFSCGARRRGEGKLLHLDLQSYRVHLQFESAHSNQR